MNCKTFRFMWVLIILAASALGCNLFSQVTSRAGEVQDTAQALATGVDAGQGLLATAKAALTADGSRLLKTAVNLATEQGPQFLDTAQAFATEQGPEMVASAQALATQIAAKTPQVPEDVPLVEGERANLTALLGMVAYSTPLPYDEVLAFYLAEMPANGWELVNEGTYQIPNTAVLNYQKIDRKATVSLSVVNSQSYILILIQDR